MARLKGVSLISGGSTTARDKGRNRRTDAGRTTEQRVKGEE